MPENAPDTVSVPTDSVASPAPSSNAAETVAQNASATPKLNSADFIGLLVTGAAVALFKPIVEDLLRRLKHIGPDGLDFYPPEKEKIPPVNGGDNSVEG